MSDPFAWLWSFADFENAVFDETSMRIIVDDGCDRLAATNFVVRTENTEHAPCPSRVPSIAALSQVTTLGENGLIVDHDAVLAAILDVDTIGSTRPSPLLQATNLR